MFVSAVHTIHIDIHQGCIEPPKAARGHTTYIDGKMLSVTKYSFHMPCFSLEWLRPRLQCSTLAKNKCDFSDTEIAIEWHTLSCCWEWWMFELHSTILTLSLAHYPDWSVTLAGRDSLPPLGWHFLSITDVLLQETFPINVSNLPYTIF